jgi:hypothetical protein
LAGSAVIAIAGVVALQLARSHRSEQVLQTAWNDAAGCLFGGPLEEGERGSVRFRGIKLAVTGTDDKWPERCADALATLHHALIKQNKESELAKRAHALMQELVKGHGLKNLSYLVDEIVDAATAMGLSTKEIPRPDDDPPPEPEQPWNISTLPAEARLTEVAMGAHAVSADRWPGVDLHLLFDDAKAEIGPIVCTFRRAGPSADCIRIAGAARSGSELRLGGTSDTAAAPLLFGREMGQDVVYRADTGAEVARGNIQTAWIAGDGYVAMTTGPTDEAGSFELWQHRPDEGLTKRAVGPDDLKATTLDTWAAAYGQLVVLAATESDDEEEGEPEPPLIHALSLPASQSTGSFSPVGTIDYRSPTLSFCASDEQLTLKLGNRSGYLTFFAGDRWSQPARYERLGALVQCRDDHVLLHDFGPIRACGAKGCKEAGLADASFGDLSVVRSRRTVLSNALLGIAETKSRQGVRFVHGEGEVKVLFDDLVRRGEVQVNSTLVGTRIFSRAGFAVVILFTEDGVAAIHFDEKGTPRPAKITWKG